jgi:hypothetical protein
VAQAWKSGTPRAQWDAFLETGALNRVKVVVWEIYEVALASDEGWEMPALFAAPKPQRP